MIMKPISLKPYQNLKKRYTPISYVSKTKKCENIKGRGCADGRKKDLYTHKDEFSPPTVSTE